MKGILQHPNVMLRTYIEEATMKRQDNHKSNRALNYGP